MHVALSTWNGLIAPGNMTETWMTSIDSMLTKSWIGDILTVTCVREPVSFMFTFYTEIVHIHFKPHLQDKYNVSQKELTPTFRGS